MAVNFQVKKLKTFFLFRIIISIKEQTQKLKLLFKKAV